MRVSTGVGADLTRVAAEVRDAEALGYDVLAAEEAAHEPFTRLTIAAEHSAHAELMTSVAVAFARSPYVTAHLAWALQRFSGGRFVLGLGTQVRGHIERRFSMPWGSPGPRLAEYVRCMRAIWDTWQTGTRPAFEGRYYRFTLMNPTSSPGAIEHPHIPVVLAAVNPYNARMAGEVADGLVIHAFTTARHTREVLLPAMLEGARRSGRDPAALRISGGGFIATGRDADEVGRAREAVRTRIAYYASTPSYRGVLELHGWEETGRRLHELSRSGSWDEMPKLVSDQMLAEFAVSGTWEELPERLAARYAGLCTQIALPSAPAGERDRARLVDVIEAVRAIPAWSPGAGGSAPAR